MNDQAASGRRGAGPPVRPSIGGPAPRRPFAAWIALLALTLPTAPLPAQSPDVRDDPEAERRLMQLPDGFEAQLVAAEPTIVNPLSMNFDPQGRLWVLCAPRYPQLLPGQEPRDYVVVLEDFAADGRARKSRVFVEGLTVPTGLMPGDGGVYVGQGEALYHFRDTRGAGKADERRVVLTGFGTADTHHTLNTFRWGPGGALYFNQGVYIESTVETPYGPRRHFGGCVWQLRTDRLRLEVYDRSILPNNTWGHAFDPWGQSFLASAWPGALNLCLPDSPLHRVTNPEIVPNLKLTQVGGERHCGLEVVTGRHFPDDWQGNLVTGDFLSHRIYRYALTDDGHRFAARPLPPLVVCKHPKFRPIDLKMGPDGALYVADLYQQIIQHNQVNFRDPRRDHTRGRVWRIVRKDRPLLPVVNLAAQPTDRLLDRLREPEWWTRQQVKRVLAERDGKAVAAALAAWVRHLDPADADLQRDLLEALWAYQTIDHVEPDLLRRLLAAPDPRVRSAAVRVLGDWHDRVGDAERPAERLAERLLATAAADVHPRVRLEAVLAAGRIPTAGAAQAALAALDRPLDPLLDFALRRAMILLRPYWYPEFQAGRLTLGGDGRRLSFALQAVRAADAVPALAALLQAGKVPAEHRPGVLQILAGLGTPAQQGLAWEAAQGGKPLDAADRARLLDALAQAARSRKAVPPGDRTAVQALFADPDANVAGAALRLAGAWKLDGLRGELVRWAAAEADATRRRAAVAALVELGGAAGVQELAKLTAASRPFAVRVAATAGLAALDVPQAARSAGALLREAPPPGADVAPLYTALARHKGGVQALADALKAQPPAADSARVGLRVLAGLGVPAPELAAVLRDAAGHAGQRRQLDRAELKRLIGLVQTHGDPARGEAIFRRPELGCQQCHAIGGAGGRVGPDLSGIGTSAQLDYLVESVVLPGKVVREGYTTAHVTTADGKAFSGVVVRESPAELVLRDPLRDEIVIPVRDIDEKRVGGSLMPDGLDQTLTDAELADLVRFLSELGRPGPFAVSHVRVARTWQVLTAPPASFALLDPAALGKALDAAELPWAPAYSKVSGELPLGDGIVYARCRLDVLRGGKVRLALDDAHGLALWVDGRPAPVDAATTVDLPAGTHTLTFRIDRARRPVATLRCEVRDVPSSPAQASFLAGR